MEPIFSGLRTPATMYRGADTGGGTGGGPSRAVIESLAFSDHIDAILNVIIESDGTDAHFASGEKPWARIQGAIKSLSSFPVLDPNTIQRLVYEILRDDQIRHFETTGSVDFAYSVPKNGRRFRGNCFKSDGHVAASLRLLNQSIPSIEELGLPKSFHDFAKLPRGLVLVCGPTGSGKSTSLAALVGEINDKSEKHIISIENPIEYVHRSKKSLIHQREIGRDTPSFQLGLRDALRQDPDVILIGELRDQETIETAIHAAETGHLVLATIHTLSAADAMDRMVDVFEPKRQEGIRIMLAQAIEAVVCQQLVPSTDNKNRVLATEVMIASPAVRSQIKSGKNAGLRDTISTNQPKGMWTMNQNLRDLVRESKISKETAIALSTDMEEMRKLLG